MTAKGPRGPRNATMVHSLRPHGRTPAATLVGLLVGGLALLAWSADAASAEDGPQAGGPGELPGVAVLKAAVRQHEKVEFAFTPEQPPDNPFDPNEVTLDGVFVLPSGRQVRVPGFWFQDYRRDLKNVDAQGIDRIEVLTAVERPGWRVRFSSGEVGPHRAVLELKDRRGVRRSAELAFTVAAGPARGMIRVSPRNAAFLEDRAGKVFFPIGQNLCMYQLKEGTYYYDRLLTKLGSAGGNYVRLWQEYSAPAGLKLERVGPGDSTFAGFPLETQITGLGRYDLPSAWRLDYVTDLCERLDVRWQLTFEMTVWWQRRHPKWSRNPYRVEHGGPIEDPADYFTNAAARELVRRRLRYSVARWGWTAHLLAWELWNEVDNVEGFTSDACAAWHREMGDYLRRIDPWGRLITTSWRDRQTFALPQIDIVQGHSYFRPQFDAAEYALQDTDHLMRGFGKPFFFGEQGLQGPLDVDPKGKHFHDCLWATALSGAAGTGMYWWWHNYIEPYNLYHHYTPLAKFIDGVDLPAFKWQAARTSRPNIPVTLRLYGLVATDRALLWVHDPLGFRIIDGKGVDGPGQSGASLNVIGLVDGEYRIDWWDTTTGQVVRTDRGRVNHLRHVGYGLELRPPDFHGDIAAQVSRLPEKTPE